MLEADCRFGDGSLDRLAEFCLHAGGSVHHEYDFGSYKRAWQWSVDNLDLKAYDFVYLVNDSVFGPLTVDLESLLLRMETSGSPAFALAMHPHGHSPHLQSWFIGMDRMVFGTSWFGTFLLSVRRAESKEEVCELYENGFTRLLEDRGIVCRALFRLTGKSVYNAPKRLFRKGLPFVKKSSFTRHCGCLGAQLKYVLDHVSAECRDAVVEDASRLYGREYVRGLLVSSPFVMAARYFRYLHGKLGRRSA